MKTDKPRRCCRATVIIEVVASFMIILPLILGIAFLAAGVAQICTFKNAVTICAGTAARKLAILYGQDPILAVSNPSIAFQDITFLNIVTSPTQFSVPAGEQGWNLNGAPQTVTVQVSFDWNKDSNYIWCPLLTSSGTTITARATHALEGF